MSSEQKTKIVKCAVQRSCRVTISDLRGVSHSVTVVAESLFEAAAAALAILRQEQWANEALTPNAVLRVEVQLPAVVHEVSLKAVERWANGTSVSPKDHAVKRRLRP